MRDVADRLLSLLPASEAPAVEMATVVTASPLTVHFDLDGDDAEPTPIPFRRKDYTPAIGDRVVLVRRGPYWSAQHAEVPS